MKDHGATGERVAIDARTSSTVEWSVVVFEDALLAKRLGRTFGDVAFEASVAKASTESSTEGASWANAGVVIVPLRDDEATLEFVREVSRRERDRPSAHVIVAAESAAGPVDWNALTALFEVGASAWIPARGADDFVESVVARAVAAAREERSWRRDDFLAVVSHELRTPLNPLLGWAEELAAGEVPEARLPYAYDTLRRNARAMKCIVDDSIEFTAEDGDVPLYAQRVEVLHVLRAAEDHVRSFARERRVTLVDRCGPTGGVVIGDAKQLERTLARLLQGALEVSDAGAAVEVRCHRSAGFVVVTVDDPHTNVSAEHLDHFFDAFWVPRGGVHRRRGALGVHLALVKRIAELHGGSVSAARQSTPESTSLTLRLPLADVAIGATLPCKSAANS